MLIYDRGFKRLKPEYIFMGDSDSVCVYFNNTYIYKNIYNIYNGWHSITCVRTIVDIG